MSHCGRDDESSRRTSGLRENSVSLSRAFDDRLGNHRGPGSGRIPGRYGSWVIGPSTALSEAGNGPFARAPRRLLKDGNWLIKRRSVLTRILLLRTTERTPSLP